MEFSAYLKVKKIDQKAFAQGDQSHYQEFKSLFEQMHPDSFTAHKLFLINQIRRRYPLTTVSTEDTKAKPKPARPKVAGKPKVAAKPVVKKSQTSTEDSASEKPKPAKPKPKVKPIIRKNK